MILSSNSAQYETEIQNGLNLNGGARTIQVDDNPNSGGDFASLSGVDQRLGRRRNADKNGLGTLYIKGAASNTYTGPTTIAGGTVVLAKTGGAVAIAGNILMSEPGDGNSTYLQLNGDNQIASTSVITFNTPGGLFALGIEGHSQTLAGIVSDPWAFIEAAEDNTGMNTNSALTINNTADCTFQGVMRDAWTGTGTGRFALVKTRRRHLGADQQRQLLHRRRDRQRRHAANRRRQQLRRPARRGRRRGQLGRHALLLPQRRLQLQRRHHRLRHGQ